MVQFQWQAWVLRRLEFMTEGLDQNQPEGGTTSRRVLGK